MHVMADGDDNMALVVANGTPFGLISIFFISSAGPHKLLARYLHLVVYVIKSMEDFVAALQVLDRPIRKHLSHAVHEIFPVFGAVKVIDHEKATFLQVLAQPVGLGVCEGPVLHLDRVNPWVVEDVIGVESYHLLCRTPINARQPVHCNEKLAIRLGVIARPRIEPSTPRATEALR